MKQEEEGVKCEMLSTLLAGLIQAGESWDPADDCGPPQAAARHGRERWEVTSLVLRSMREFFVVMSTFTLETLEMCYLWKFQNCPITEEEKEEKASVYPTVGDICIKQQHSKWKVKVNKTFTFINLFKFEKKKFERKKI